MSIKVLVADDSITIQKVIGIIFGGDEYSLTVVDNGKAAVDKAREIIPDIMLIDALMPGMTGYEVAEAVRLTPSLTAIPILIMTGSFEPFDEEKAKKCGADDFIAKPFESQQIITKVRELLELGLSRAQPSPTQSAAESFREQTPEALQQVAPADIWGAFTPEAEPASEEVAATLFAAPSAASVEQDVFAIVTEENDVQPAPSDITAGSQPHHTGSKWIPVEENTFEFEEETIEEPTLASFAVQAPPAQEAPFGDVTFKEEAAASATPAFADFTAPYKEFEASPAPESLSVSEMTTPAAVPQTVSLTEEQLKAAITSASKEVIERIVWEVVPDLAEAMIREAIRKIKAGV